MGWVSPEYQRAWKQRNPEKVRAYKRAYYKRHRDEIRQKAKEARDPVVELARVRAWCEANPEEARALHRRKQAMRRARKKGVDVEHVDPLVLLERDDGVCGICGEDVDPLNFEIDHIVSLARGGPHNYANTQPAHKVCNIKKGAG